MTQNAGSTSFSHGNSADNVASVEECADVLVRTVQQLRNENNISQEEQVSLYVTDAPLIHSTLSEFKDKIKEQAKLVDVVQVNPKAGIPMPEALPQVDCEIGDERVTVAVERQASA